MATRYVVEIPEEDAHVLLTGFEAFIESDCGGRIIDREHVDDWLTDESANPQPEQVPGAGS